jgi:hypothetical protein
VTESLECDAMYDRQFKHQAWSEFGVYTIVGRVWVMHTPCAALVNPR